MSGPPTASPATLGLASRSAGERIVSFGTVQPFHASSSDQVPLQLYQRSGPLPDWHAVCCVWIHFPVS